MKSDVSCARHGFRMPIPVAAIILLSLALPFQKACSQTRRAFLVGIDKYRPATAVEKKVARKKGMTVPTRNDDVFGPLDGAVNDVVSMQDVCCTVSDSRRRISTCLRMKQRNARQFLTA
jgi:hypothetical protein